MAGVGGYGPIYSKQNFNPWRELKPIQTNVVEVAVSVYTLYLTAHLNEYERETYALIRHLFQDPLLLIGLIRI